MKDQADTDGVGAEDTLMMELGAVKLDPTIAMNNRVIGRSSKLTFSAHIPNVNIQYSS